MLEGPIMIGGASLEMPDVRREIPLSERSRTALTPNSHDAASRRPKIFPFAMPHWVEIGFAQERFRQSREIG